MINKIKQFLGLSKPAKQTTDFSDFFYNTPKEEKRRILESVVREANKDQREMMKKYDAMQTSRS